jgi:NAD(P)H-flavin reductase
VVTALAAAEAGLSPGDNGVVYACGPAPLLKAAALLARAQGWRCWVSLEEHMGCGYGVCKGCVVPVRDGSGTRNATCCFEGPVFDAAILPGLHEPAMVPGNAGEPA